VTRRDPADNYARPELGGARGALRTLGEAAVDVRTKGGWYQEKSVAKDKLTATVRAGWSGDLEFEGKDRSPAD